MSRIRQMFVLMTALLCSVLGYAEVAPYTMDFNKTINTYGDWVVGTGWNHSTDPGSATTYNHYAWYGDGGSNGALGIGSQGDGYDILVTPRVKGEISIRVAKANGNDSYIEVYVMNKSPFGSVYVRGDQLVAADDYSSDIISAWTGNAATSYITVTIPAQSDYVLLGLRCNNVYIDNFKADSADIDYVKSMKIGSASISTSNFDMNDAGNIPIKLSVQIQNTGDLDIEKEEENFNYSVFAIKNNQEVAIISNRQFSQRLANGGTIYESPEFEINPADYLGTDGKYKIKLKVKENFSNTEYEIAEKEFTPVAHEAVLRVGTYNSTYENGIVMNYPPSRYATYVSFTIYNDGGAPMKVESIDLPDGFIITYPSASSFPYTVNAHSSFGPSIQLPQTALGKHAGDLVINTDAVNVPEGKFTIKLSGHIVGQNQFFIDGNMVPMNMINEGGWSTISISATNTVNNSMALMAKSEAPTKLISPLVSVAEGEKLTFEAARSNNSPELKVYYSTDRKNWTLAKTVTGDELSNEMITTDYGGNQLYPFSSFEVNIPSGNKYIAFESAAIYLDNVLIGEEVPIEGADVAIKSFSAENTGTVNTPWEINVALYNTTMNAVAADTYTASLFIDDAKVASANAIEIAGQKDTRFGFVYTPTSTGTKTAKVKFEGSDWSLESDPVTFTVEAESNIRVIRVGQHTEAKEVSPYSMSNNYAESEAIYTSDLLKLKPGTKINKIRYRGAFGSYANEFNQNLSLWIENTVENGFNTDEPLQLHPTAGMTAIATSAPTKLSKRGSITTSYPYEITESATIVEFDLDEPFIYNGGNIRIVSTNASAGTTGQVYFEADGTITDKAMGRTSWSTPISSNFTLQSLPVVYFGIESVPSVITGTITDKETGAPVSELTIEAQDEDGVTYSAVTDEDGKYELSIYQDMHPFVLKVTKDGYLPIKRTVTPSGESVEDFEIEYAKGLFVDQVNHPANGVKNYEIKVSATVLNAMSTSQQPDYVASLLLAGEKVAQVDAVEVGAGETETLNFTFTPHVTGNQPIVIRIEHANEFVSESEPKTINIDDEMYEGRVQVSEYSNVFQTYAPFYGRDYGTHAEMIIDKDGIEFGPGTIIKGITFRGRVGGSETIFKDMDIKAYLENTDDGSLAPLASFVPRDVEQMTKIVDTTLSICGGGTNDNPIDVFTIPIEEGFEYTGNHMRLVLMTANKEMTNIDAWWCNGNQHQSDNHAYVRTMGYNEFNNGKTYGSWRDNIMGYPTIYMDIETFKTIDGTVTGTGNVDLSGATVKLVSGNIEYAGETDSDGSYSIKVAQPTLDYTASANLKGYRDASEEVSFKEGNKTWNAFLRAYYDNNFIANQYAAVSLPFSLTEEEMSELGKFYTFEGINQGQIYFVEAENVNANSPYVFQAANDGYLFENHAATISYEPMEEVRNNVMFVGAEDNMTLDSNDYNKYFVIDSSTGNFVKAVNSDIDMYTAYLSGNDLDDDMLTFKEGVLDGIDSIRDDSGEIRIYTIDGRQIDPNSRIERGIYIINGKKVLVK